MTDASQAAAALDLPLYRRGKVRDTYDLGDLLLVVASDRISAFDVVLPTPIPGKGRILTALSRFWFGQTDGLFPNHLVESEVDRFPVRLRRHAELLRGRSLLVRKAELIDVECVVRGFMARSAWAEYRASGTVAGEPLPEGLRPGDRLPAPLFTQAVKHDDRHHVTIPAAELASLVGAALARRLEEASRDLYDVATAFAEPRGILVADTKFEFGLVDRELLLIDELLTPDSSRFWDADRRRSGEAPPSFDKQFVRDWLEASGWDRRPPAPELPPEVVAGTAARYKEALERLTAERSDRDEEGSSADDGRR